jgi:molecular chaperone GrpE (heat shock protein)
MSVKVERYKREEYERIQIELENPWLEQGLDIVLKKLKEADIDRMKPEDVKRFMDQIDSVAMEIQNIFNSQKLYKLMLQLQTKNPMLLQTLQSIATVAGEILNTKDAKKKNAFEGLVEKLKEVYSWLKRIIEGAKDLSEFVLAASVIIEMIKLILKAFGIPIGM